MAKGKVTKKTTEKSPVKEEREEPQVKEETPVKEERVEEREESVEEEEETVVVTLEQRIQNLQDVVKTIHETTGVAKSELREILRDYRAERKEAARNSRRNNKKDPNRPKRKGVSGIAKETDLSNELCDFLGVSHDTQMSRMDVNRRLFAYISENNLKDPSNGQILHPDKKLASLWGPAKFPLISEKINKETGEVERPAGPLGYGFFNMQKYMKRHYPTSSTKSN